MTTRWRRARRRPAPKAYVKYEDLLQKSDADVIVLCHAERAACRADDARREAGKHVMTEKPMATRWQDGKRMVAACDAAEVRLFVVKQNRRNATLQLLKRAVEQRRFGRIYMVTINVFWTRPQAYYDSGEVARHLGVRRRRLHEPGEPLRGSARLADRTGRERAGLHRRRSRATSRSRTPA